MTRGSLRKVTAILVGTEMRGTRDGSFIFADRQNQQCAKVIRVENHTEGDQRSSTMIFSLASSHMCHISA